MSTPRDSDGFDDDDARSWQEPTHLGGDEQVPDGPDRDETNRDEPAEDDAVQDTPNIADRRKQPRDSDHSVDPASWRPAGWDLPPAEPQRQRSDPGPDSGPSSGSGSERRGLFGGRRRQDPETERAFTYQGDVVGAQHWALQRGWTVSDGTAPEDAALQQLISSAPVRMSRDHRPGSVVRGRAGTLDLVAFDAVYTSGRYVVPQYAITAAPLLGAPPALRLSPARLWKHGVGGMVQIPSDSSDFDRRWQLLAAEDGPQVRRLAADADVQRLLLGTDDGDEFWTAGGYLAAIRPDGHRPQLIEHHIRLLTALVGAFAAGY